jgi:MOSC domain-containing protein YiiM
MDQSDDGRIDAIWVKRATRGPMDAVERASLVAGRGIEGNANQGGWRQVTLISKEAWEAAEASLGATVAPSSRRANVMVSGVDLRQSRDRVIGLGPCTVLVKGETRPCTRMDAAHVGLRDALDPDWRGGAFGVVVTGGVLSVGDRASWVEAGT